MFFSYLSRLFKQISKSRWIQFYFALVIVSTILTVSVLIKTLANTNKINQNQTATTEAIENEYEFSVYLTAKGYKIVYENILFIVFEVWRIWCLTDGIVHLNSLTILASAWLSIFSILFNILLVIESRKWMSNSYDPLKLENMHLQIAMTVVMFVLFAPIILSAYKTSKIIGWQVYKKIGSSIELQNMYNVVQWFALLLKIDIFFEVFIMICTAIVTNALVYRILCCAMVPILIVSLILARIAITKESFGMMLIFFLSQITLLGMNVYSFIGLFKYSPEDQWFAGISYVFASMICICISIYLSILCFINFGKGLKPFVNWMPFQGTKKHMEEPIHYSIESGLLGTTKNENRHPIDDDDDDDDFKFMNEKSYHSSCQSPVLQANMLTNYSAISRTSLERVESNPPSIYKLDSIKIISPSMSNKPPRLALKPVHKDTLILSPISTSPAVLRAVNRDDSYDDISLSSATISGLNDFATAKNSIEIMQNK